VGEESKDAGTSEERLKGGKSKFSKEVEAF
jgi:hypothetical protein